jgi:hypothetical protein
LHELRRVIQKGSLPEMLDTFFQAAERQANFFVLTDRPA